MFGFSLSRKKATNTALEALRPMIGSIQHFHGMPKGFWQDAYVLGFLYFTIGHIAKASTSGRISQGNLGQVLCDVLTNLSNQNGAVIAQRGNDLAMSSNAEFKRGMEDAAAIQFYMAGVHQNEANDPLVTLAKSIVESGSFGSGNRREQIAGAMFSLSLMKEVRERLA